MANAQTPAPPEGAWWERPDEPQTRYSELRWDDTSRMLSGTLVRYGDTAELSWGDKERFEPGAFGNVADVDLILNVQHDRAKPLARSGGGGISLDDTSERLRMEATLPDTADARDVLSLIRHRVLRGLSVEFYPVRSRREGDVVVISEAKLKNVAVVDRPAYKQSTLDWRHKMKADDIRQMIEEAMSKRADDDTGSVADTAAAVVAAAVSGEFAELRAERDAAVKKRNEAIAKAAKAVETAEAAEQRAETLAQAQTTVKDQLVEARAEGRAEAVEEMRGEAAERAALLLRIDPLLADGLETRQMTTHDLLVAAVADEVDGAAERSEDYLTAKVESILERRQAADDLPAPARPAPGGTSADAGYAPHNLISSIETRFDGAKEVA
ncbi:MAG: hypothetical protein F4Y08_07015 [Caldilineaceae bacterium SB0662_bin_9]|uniref:Prohead serine protease domain-containing protein n=1 Tax=Caldilineaceae bacterium SB0662_bin_9 TaxID=2605258 RepID=A0A6B1DTF8_9CHLR|nr:hypothetical protein [Caldilineaceae bacterium SB0662_bin_9]